MLPSHAVTLGIQFDTGKAYKNDSNCQIRNQQWGDDERVILFVRLREGITLDDTLRQRIVKQIRANTTPRHVPAKVVQVHDIPRTKSGKIVELAVRNVVHERPVKNVEALANPEALEEFRNRPELAD